jgi:hypothetical protein
MKYRLITCLTTTVIALALPAGAITSDAGRKLKNAYSEKMESLKEDIEDALPKLNGRAKTDYEAARKAALKANEAIKEAEAQLGKLKQAQGLVGHAKGKWIKDAKKGLQKAEQALKQAKTPDAKSAAKSEIKKWEENLKAGEEALAERQAMLDQALKTQDRDKKALADAQQALADARQDMLEVIEAIDLKDFLASDKLDEALTSYVILKEAGIDKLVQFAEQSDEHAKLLEVLFSNTELRRQMLVADGATDGNYGRAMEILRDIQTTSVESRSGIMQRLAVAIALEHATPRKQRNAVAATDADAFVDPVKRYFAYEKAYYDGLLDPQFKNLTAWDLRMVVDGEEPDEIAAWGREMLRNYRPDHVTTKDYRWRYVALVRTDVRYGSQDNQYDEDELQFFQNILKNGGICGRRAFIGRFILRAFGIPTAARPQRGHGALIHWTPDGWVPCLGAGWGSGWTKTRYDRDEDFLASTQARATGDAYRMVKRAQWVGDVLGERPVYGLNSKHKPDFWYGVSLQIQGDIIENADSMTLDAVGKDIAEANVTKEAIEIAQVTLDEDDRKIRTTDDEVIIIPAAATDQPTSSTGKIIFMESVLGGKQLHYSRNGGSATFEYTVKTRNPGLYELASKLVTPSWQQNLEVTVNDNDPVLLPLPFTVGMWETTEPVRVELKSGRNTLKFTRKSDGQAKGFSIKEFTLTPVE